MKNKKWTKDNDVMGLRCGECGESYKDWDSYYWCHRNTEVLRINGYDEFKLVRDLNYTAQIEENQPWIDYEDCDDFGENWYRDFKDKNGIVYCDGEVVKLIDFNDTFATIEVDSTGYITEIKLDQFKADFTYSVIQETE